MIVRRTCTQCGAFITPGERPHFLPPDPPKRYTRKRSRRQDRRIVEAEKHDR